MKISKQQLKQIIKEELENVLRKEEYVEEPYGRGSPRYSLTDD